MKKSILIILLGFFINSNAENVKIKGLITDTAYTSVILSPVWNTKMLDVKKEFHPKGGLYEFNINVTEASLYRLNYRDQYISIFLMPNSEVVLNIDRGVQENSFHFSGSFTKENEYLNAKTSAVLTSKELRDTLKNVALKSSAIEFKSYIDTQYNLKKNQFEVDARRLELSPDFVRLYLDNHLTSMSYQLKFLYPRFLKINSDSFFTSNSSYLDFFKSIPVNESYLNSPTYLDVQLLYLKTMTTITDFRNKNLDSVEDVTYFKTLIQNAKKNPNETLKSKLTEMLLGEYIAYYGLPTDLKEEIKDFVSTISDANKSEMVKKKLLALTAYDRGKSAPLFTFNDNSGNVRQLKEFVGKVVYLDIWASWCGPCKAEMPFSKELVEHYKDRKDIVFLYISIDENKANWEKSLIELKLYMGIQGIAYPNGFNSDFAKKYQVQAIPHYVLIDKSGNLISAKAFRPSQKDKIIPLIDKALGLK